MKKLVSLLLLSIRKQQFLITCLIIGVAVFFLYTDLQSEIQAFPEFTNVQVKIITQYPGKAPEEVERFVTRPLEIVTNGLPGLINSRSVTMFGLSSITLTFGDNTPSKQARVDTQTRIHEAELPDGVQAELEPDASPLGEIYRFVIKGNLPVDELRMIEDWTVERELKSVPGVTDVTTFGGPTRTFDVRLDPKKIWDLNISVDDVADKLSKNNLNAGGGYLNRGQEAYLVRAIGLYNSVGDLENAIVTSRGGSPIRIKDIGHVELGSLPRLGQVGFNESSDVVEGIVLMRRGEDSLRTVERVKEAVEHLNKILPSGVKIVKTYDRSELIERCIHTVFHNVMVGIILVLVILVLGFGLQNWPLVLAILLIIPFSLLCAVFGVLSFGYAPNLISLGAVDFGIIVETAILAAEAVIAGIVFKKIKDDELIARTLGKVFGPSFVCALVLIIAFIPILCLQQVEGKIFRPLGITLVSAVIGGQIGAFLLIPWFSRWLKPIEHKSTRIHHICNLIIDRILNLSRALAKVLPFPRLMIGCAFAFLVGFLYLSVGKEFLPDLNEGSMWIRAKTPSTISMEESAKVADEVRRRLKQIPEVIDVVSQTGRPDDGTDSAGFDNIEFSVSLIPVDQWHSARTLDGLVQVCQKALVGMEGIDFSYSQYLKDNIDEAISGVKGELAFKIFGTDLYKLQKKASEVAKILKETKGSEDVSLQILTGQPEFRVTMNHPNMANLGVDASAIAGLVESSLSGKKAGQILDEQNRIVNIFVYPHLFKKITSSELMALPIATANGTHVTLDDVADLNTVDGVARIYREKGERRIAVTTSVRDRDVVSFVQEATKRIEKEVKLEDGYNSVWSGSFQSASRAATQLLLLIPLCFFIILVLLRSWFGNWSRALQLLWQLPFSLFGGLLLLKLMGLNLSISAASGGIVLCGVAFLTGMMILTEFEVTNSAYTAIQNKGFGIILSNAVAIFGLIPAAASSGVGAEISKPFAVMIVGGLCSSLVMSLLFYPLIISSRPVRPA
jgi:cobalt-zinc-cadmium resistance protein CzcA